MAILTYLRSWQRHPQVDVTSVPVEGDAGRGAAVYQAECAECHGARGEGVDAVQLRNPMLLASATDGFLQYAVLHGRTGTRMPAFRDRLAPDQVDVVVAFIRSLDPQRRPPAHAHPGPDQLAEIPALSEMQLVINPEGRQARLTLREERYVPAAQVKRALDEGRKMILIDARATSDWLSGRIPGAIPMPFYEMDDIVEALPRDGTWIVAYCACPHAASGRVVDSLRQHGFENTAVLDEGIEHWREQGFPMAEGPAQP